jgi:predicted GIY-YIG superfamily endonuclease
MKITPPVQSLPNQPWTPEKVYPFRRAPDKKIAINWTPTVKKQLSRTMVVYQIKNTKNGKRYIGQTSNLFKRLSSHKSTSKNRIPTLLSRELLVNPEQFVVGAIATDSPDELETSLIAKKGTKKEYNQRNGRGGGQARKPVHIEPQAVRHAQEAFAKTYVSPAKFALKKSKSRISHTLPKELHDVKNTIYVIQRRKLNGTISRYVGCTERKVIRRIQEHLSGANHYRSLRNRHNRVYRAMHKHTKECFISIIQDTLPKNFPAALKEKIVIQFYKNQGNCTLFNKNRGGGGGSKK